MKNFYFIFFLILSSQIHAQDPLLFEHDWELEKIVTEEETFTATPYPSPEADQTYMDYLYFYGSEDSESGSFFFGVYHNAMADLILFNNENPSFTIEEFSNHFGGASPAEMFFNMHFVYEDYMEHTFLNPYTYAFREEEEKIYLDITNGEGDVATFWTSTLSTPNFQEIEFSFYPNPVKDRLHLESPQSEPQKLEIFDMNGKQVLQSDLVGQEAIDVSNLKSGIYLLQVETREGKATRKLVKE